MSTPSGEFAAVVREHFPEGLTGIISIGGTRTSYILEHDSGDPPGKIADPAEYARFTRAGYVNLARMFFELGGQNLIMPVLSYQSFYERGQEYADRFARLVMWLIDDGFQRFYREEGIDPYFAGLEPLQRLAPETTGRQIASAFTAFRQTWAYQPGRRKLIWEIAPIPPLTFWQAVQSMSDADRHAFDQELSGERDMEALFQKLFRFYACAAFGTEIPEPHFYLGTNRKGDLKLRAQLSLALLPGRNVRLYYTPYPSLFTPRETLQTVLDDVIQGRGRRSRQKDYEGQMTHEMLIAERARVAALRANPHSTLGLLHPGSRVEVEEED